MARPAFRTIHDESGFALFTVTVFVLVQILSGLAFFAMVSYETKGALYREDSSEAFYLADGAIERARARFLLDRSWRDGWSGEPAGRGTYDLAVTDTVCGGQNLVKLAATGHVGAANRKIEALAAVPPSAEDITLLVRGNAKATGNICIEGSVHVDGTADFGNDDVHLKCDPSLTRGFDITPPAIYTDPEHFPNATYYYVMGVASGSAYKAKVYDRFMTEITASTTDLAGKVSYNPGTKTYTFSFTSNGDVNTYFDDAAGKFKRQAGDASVVVNFGEPISNPPDTKSAVVFSDGQAVNLTATIINARFTGVTESDRTDSNYWTGAPLQVKQVTFAPKNGISAICYDLTRQGSSQVHLGTSTWPGLFYVMRDVSGINANFDATGSVIVLRDWTSTGGPALTYSGGYLVRLPGYLRDGWQPGVSGTLKVERWRETGA